MPMRYIWASVAIGGFAVAVFVITWIQGQPRISATIRDVTPLTLRIEASGINEITGVDLFTAQEHLWRVARSTFPVSFADIKYGAIPDGASQSFPPFNGQPREIMKGEKVYVRIVYQYDRLFTAFSSEGYFRIECVNKHEFGWLGRQAASSVPSPR